MKSIVIFVLTFCAFATAYGQPDTLWTTCIGGVNQEYPFSICRTSDGGYAVSGTGWIGNDTSFAWLAKVDDGGGLLWYKTYRVTLGPSTPVFQSPDGGFAVISSLQEHVAPPNWRSVILLLKLNAVGDSVRSRVFEEPHDIAYLAADTTADGGFIVAATLQISNYRADTWLLKLNAAGDSLWSRLITSIGYDALISVTQTRDGGYAVAGLTYEDTTAIVPWLLKTDGIGNELWRHTFVYANTYTSLGSMHQTRDGGFVLAGTLSHVGETGFRSWLIKTNENGDSIWSRTCGGNSDHVPNFVLETSDGGYLVTGASSQNVPDLLWVMKTNAQGDSMWSETWTGIWAFSGYYGRYAVETSDHGYAIVGSSRPVLSPHCPQEHVEDGVLIRMAPDTALAVNEREITVLDFSLQQNYPNPFNSVTTIEYDLPKPTDVHLRVFDVLGREAAVLVNGRVEAGKHAAMLTSEKLASGVYFYRLEIGQRMLTRKMLLLK